MAQPTYRANVTQTVAPAAAGVSSLQRASALEAETAKTIGDTLKTVVDVGFGVYQQNTLSNITKEAARMGDDYLFRNELEANAKQVELELAQKSGAADADANKEVIGTLTERLGRLRELSKGGMSPSVYATNVTAYAKEQIAANPHLADKIRATVTNMTGLHGADRWAVQQFAERTLSAKQQSDKQAEHFRQKDIEMVQAENIESGYSQEQLYNMSLNNDPEWLRLRTNAADKVRMRNGVKAAEEEIKGLRFVGDEEADTVLKPKLFTMLQGRTVDVVIGKLDAANKEGKLGKIVDHVRKGGNIADHAELAAEVEIWSKQNQGVVNESYTNAMAALNLAYSKGDGYGNLKGRMSHEKFKEIKDGLETFRDAQLARWSDKNSLVATALTAHKYAKESHAMRTQMMDITLKHMNLLGPVVIQQYMLNEESLKKQNPEAHSIIHKAFQEQASLKGTLQPTDAKVTALANGVANAAANGTGPIVPPNATADQKQTIKATHQVITSNAMAALERTLTNQSDLTEADVNTLRATLDVSIQNGANALMFARDAGKYGKAFQALSEPTKNTIKAGVSEYSTAALDKINVAKKEAEKAFNTKLSLSVNDAGDIVVMKAQTNIYGGGAQLSQAEDAAIAEFRKRTAPMLMNVVNVRSMVTGENKNSVAKEYVDVLTGKQEYKPFFSLTGEMPVDTMGVRPDGTPKDTGFKGVLKDSKGRDVTEYSISSEDVLVNGKEVDFPTIVPTLSEQEVGLMLTDIIPNNKRIPDSIYQKAVDHANKRIEEGKSPFFDSKKEMTKSTTTGRKVTMAEVAKIAANNKISIDKALEHARAQGYSTED